jgi:hypothetical protein
MSQYDFGTINPDAVGGTELAAMLNQWRDAMHSGHRGGTRPGYVGAGMVWVDDSATPWLIKRYDGAVDIVEAEYDASADTVSFRSRSPVIVKTSAYTVTADDFGRIVKVDATSAPITITLPAISAAKDGFPVIVAKIDASANAVTVVRVGSDTIGPADATSLVLSLQDQVVDLRADAANANWVKLTTIGNFVSASGGTMTGDLELEDARLVVTQDGHSFALASDYADIGLSMCAMAMVPVTDEDPFPTLFLNQNIDGELNDRPWRICSHRDGSNINNVAWIYANGNVEFVGKTFLAGLWQFPVWVDETRIWQNQTSNQLLFKQGSNPANDDDGLPLAGGGMSLARITLVTASGDWTKPAGLKAALVKLVGGGGGGGGVEATNGTQVTSGSGGGGGWSEKLIPASALDATETVTIGAGGAGAGGYNSGVAGGTTSFGAHLSATGGALGVRARAANNSGASGAGGVGAGGVLDMNGEDGVSSSGGSTLLGIGGLRPPSGSNGASGSGYGAGGSGCTTSGSNNRTGGAGLAGVVVVYEYE